MKLRSLPETDLARIAPMQYREKCKELERFRLGRPMFSYDPVRSLCNEIFNIYPPMFKSGGATDFSIIEKKLRSKCKNKKGLVANMEIAECMYQYAIDNGVEGHYEDFFPMSISGSWSKVVYWLRMCLVIEGSPIVPLIDPRRKNKLTDEGLCFAFSMMHIHIRESEPDYKKVRLGIFQFSNNKGEARRPILHTDEGIKLYTFDELELMITETYDIWRDVCEERERDSRRGATGTYGPLL